jgi:hypothetical protein
MYITKVVLSVHLPTRLGRDVFPSMSITFHGVEKEDFLRTEVTTHYVKTHESFWTKKFGEPVCTFHNVRIDFVWEDKDFVRKVEAEL